MAGPCSAARGKQWKQCGDAVSGEKVDVGQPRAALLATTRERESRPYKQEAAVRPAVRDHHMMTASTVPYALLCSHVLTSVVKTTMLSDPDSCAKGWPAG